MPFQPQDAASASSACQKNGLNYDGKKILQGNTSQASNGRFPLEAREECIRRLSASGNSWFRMNNLYSYVSRRKAGLVGGKRKLVSTPSLFPPSPIPALEVFPVIPPGPPVPNDLSETLDEEEEELHEHLVRSIETKFTHLLRYLYPGRLSTEDIESYARLHGLITDEIKTHLESLLTNYNERGEKQDPFGSIDANVRKRLQKLLTDNPDATKQRKIAWLECLELKKELGLAFLQYAHEKGQQRVGQNIIPETSESHLRSLVHAVGGASRDVKEVASTPPVPPASVPAQSLQGTEQTQRLPTPVSPTLHNALRKCVKPPSQMRRQSQQQKDNQDSQRNNEGKRMSGAEPMHESLTEMTRDKVRLATRAGPAVGSKVSEKVPVSPEAPISHKRPVSPAQCSVPGKLNLHKYWRRVEESQMHPMDLYASKEMPQASQDSQPWARHALTSEARLSHTLNQTLLNISEPPPPTPQFPVTTCCTAESSNSQPSASIEVIALPIHVDGTQFVKSTDVQLGQSEQMEREEDVRGWVDTLFDHAGLESLLNTNPLAETKPSNSEGLLAADDSDMDRKKGNATGTLLVGTDVQHDLPLASAEANTQSTQFNGGPEDVRSDGSAGIKRADDEFKSISYGIDDFESEMKAVNEFFRMDLFLGYGDPDSEGLVMAVESDEVSNPETTSGMIANGSPNLELSEVIGSETRKQGQTPSREADESGIDQLTVERDIADTLEHARRIDLSSAPTNVRELAGWMKEHQRAFDMLLKIAEQITAARHTRA